MERAEEEWGKVERVEEELSGTYLNLLELTYVHVLKNCVVCEKVCAYVRT